MASSDLTLDSIQQVSLEQNEYIRYQTARTEIVRTREAYTAILLALIERNNLRESEDKDRLASLDNENRRLKALLEASNSLESKYLQSRALVTKFQENEDKLLTEWRKTNRELLETKAKYEALSVHTQHKLEESGKEIQRITENYQTDSAALKAKIIRYESTTQALQRSLIAKEKEVEELRKTCHVH